MAFPLDGTLNIPSAIFFVEVRLCYISAGVVKMPTQGVPVVPVRFIDPASGKRIDFGTTELAADATPGRLLRQLKETGSVSIKSHQTCVLV